MSRGEFVFTWTTQLAPSWLRNHWFLGKCQRGTLDRISEVLATSLGQLKSHTAEMMTEGLSKILLKLLTFNRPHLKK